MKLNQTDSRLSKVTIATMAIFILSVLPLDSLSAHAVDTLPYKMRPSKQEMDEYYAAALLADTGRMVRPNNDLSTYTAPGQCLGLIQRTSAGVWRSGERVLLRPYTMEDSLPTLAKEVGIKCLENMTPHTVDEMDLYNLMLAASFIGDTAKMKDVVKFYITREYNDTAARIRFIVDAGGMANAYIKPVNFQFLADIAQMLEGYGKKTLKPTVSYLMQADLNALVNFDTAAMRIAAENRHAYMARYTDEEILDAGFPLLRSIVHHDSLLLTEFRRQSTWKSDLQRLIDVKWEDKPSLKNAQNEYFFTPLNRVGDQPAELEPVGVYPLGTDPKPETGRVTLYYRQSHPAIAGLTGLTRDLVSLKRLHDKYHADGFDVVIVSLASGFLWASPPLSPEKEAPIHGWFIRDYLKLPFKVVVNDVKIDTLSDGRLVKHRPLWELWRGESNPGYIVGKDGTVQSFDLPGAGREAFLSAVIERELAK